MGEDEEVRRLRCSASMRICFYEQIASSTFCACTDSRSWCSRHLFLDRDIKTSPGGRPGTEVPALLLGEQFSHGSQPEPRGSAPQPRSVAGQQKTKTVNKETHELCRIHRRNLIAANLDGQATAYLAGASPRVKKTNSPRRWAHFSGSWVEGRLPLHPGATEGLGARSAWPGGSPARRPARGPEEPTPEGLHRYPGVDCVFPRPDTSYAKAASLFGGWRPPTSGRSSAVPANTG